MSSTHPPSAAPESATEPPTADGSTNNTIIETMLDLEEIDRDLYRSKKLWVPLGARGVFGGNVVGQALVAATNTVSTEYSVHSLHSYFLLPGDPTTPILYHVERVRDGKSYCTRTVRATQRGNNIFVCTASFQVPRPEALKHQYPMPDVPHHSTLESQEDLIKGLIDNPKIPKQITELLKLQLKEPVALDFKDTKRHTLKELMDPPVRTEQSFWIKCKGQLGDALALHQCVVAYGSDHNLLNTVPLAHGSTWFTRRGPKSSVTMMASLDHSMWFHSPFRADEWMLYVCETPRSGDDRGLTFGRIYKEDGTLAVSVAQEGVVRMHSDSSAAEKPKL
ncbi:peroxisomal long-chain acyl-CoA thioesterase 1 [Mortierella sp. GBAus27b]|nr:Acyl-CoA thioesterase 8 [Mortierella sp. GBA43]KAI8353862.1 peroxisomal long-chain acyl-CoA thioesterase 1 [Mortierella sp. GBAus27b]